MDRHTTKVNERQKSSFRPTHYIVNGFPRASGWNGAGGNARRKLFREILLEKATSRNSIRTSLRRKEALVQPGKHARRNDRVVLSYLELSDSLFWKP
jgi:hypothetical protein